MSPAQKAGLVIGNKYRITKHPDNDRTNAVGTIITFERDDGTRLPLFKYPDGSTNYWYVDALEPFEPVETKLIVKVEIPAVELQRIGETVSVKITGKLSRDKVNALLTLVFED